MAVKFCAPRQRRRRLEAKTLDAVQFRYAPEIFQATAREMPAQTKLSRQRLKGSTSFTRDTARGQSLKRLSSMKRHRTPAAPSAASTVSREGL